MTNRVLLTTALAIAGAVAVCTAGDDVPLIENPAPAEADTAFYDLEELWRQGGPDGELLLGRIADAIVDDDGAVYLLDSRMKHIEVVDADGRPLRTLGREGEGPGEFAAPWDMCWWSPGVIAVAAGHVGTLELIDVAGDPVETLVLRDESGERLTGVFAQCERLGDGFTVWGQTNGFEAGLMQIIFTHTLHDAEGRRRTELLRHVIERSMNDVDFDEEATVQSWSEVRVLDDRVYVAPRRNAYEIEVRDADGVPTRRFSRPFTSRVRSEEDIEKLRESVLARVRERVPDAEATFLPTFRDVHDLLPGPDGELWVTHAYSFPEEQEDLAGVYDVFDAEGRWLRNAALRDPHLGAQRRLRFLPGDLALRSAVIDADGGVHDPGDDADGDYGVVCYRMVRRDRP